MSRVKISVKNLRKIIKESLEAVIVEIAVLSPPMVAAKNALTQANSVLGMKANVLFSRLASNRISDIEAEQMSDEIKEMIPKSVRPEDSQRVTSLFDAAIKSHSEAKAGTEKIGNMISQTLSPAKPETNLTFMSVARPGFGSTYVR